jgi:hypothetical protein
MEPLILPILPAMGTCMLVISVANVSSVVAVPFDGYLFSAS